MMRQARSGSLMAQAYHHAILPLASVRDRRTEIRWAIRDVVLRTDRRPDGLWLPETAVDLATLRVAAEEGIRWTILAPWQAADGVDVRTPARIELGDGRWVVALFYDAGLSTTVSFDPAATADADRFAHAAVLPHLRADVSGRGMALICTDGELYGHHQPFRDLFLDRLRTDADDHAAIDALRPANAGAFDPLDLPAVHRERTSWSCHHGIARWAGSCGCTADGAWKSVLRRAFDRIAGAIDTATEMRLAALGVDAWEARDRYADVASGYLDPRAWAVAELARTHVPASEAAATLVALMSAQASRLAMFASCGWYWDDPRRIETRQVLRFAAHAVRTVDEVCGTSLEERLVTTCRRCQSPVVPRSPRTEPRCTTDPRGHRTASTRGSRVRPRSRIRQLRLAEATASDSIRRWRGMIVVSLDRTLVPLGPPSSLDPRGRARGPRAQVRAGAASRHEQSS